MLKLQILHISFIFFIFSCQSSSGQMENDNTLKSNKTYTDKSQTEKSESNTNDTISIIGVGDIMLGTNYPKSPNYLPPNNNCKPLLEEVIHILKDADLTFGNNEGVYSDNTSTAKSCSSDNCYRFSMPEKFADCLTEAGFDVLSIANNHVGDLGSYGRNNTVKVLTEKGFNFAGLSTHPYTTFEKNGIKYGFTAFAPNEGTNIITDIKNAKKIVEMLDSISDIVIVSFHGGAEGNKYQHVTKEVETFLGQNRGNVYKFAHEVIESGADIVFGHGPHVTRAVDIYKDRFIIYSMGNFCTYRRFNLSGPNGIAPIVKVFVNKKGEFLKAKIFSVQQYEHKGTLLDSQNRAFEKIKTLTKEDFPELSIYFSDNNEIFKGK
ncbi:MAG: CapA family protein [Bacteroidales bacterium]|nr:CapA family protein [Bacteroidales bacterium]MBN2757518.1 CapA family protein [Bacteroidales bacterium]